MKKVALACGGTGGHIFPAVGLAEEMQRRYAGIDLFFICGRLDIEDRIFRHLRGRRVVSVQSAPFSGVRSFGDPRFLIKLAQGFFQSLAILRNEKPDVVVGFGGYFSFPVLAAARALGIRCAIHEQNVLPGKANRWLSRVVDGVAVSFDETLARLPARLRQVRVTGNPLRAAIAETRRDEALRFFGFSDAKRTLLVLGGSQGAESLNRVFLDSLRFWSPAMKADVQVLHLCGRMLPEQCRRLFGEEGVPASAHSFFERMDWAYSVADFALGRAGATFLAELAARGIPSILIPYPFGDGHQRANAALYARAHEAFVIEQAELTPQALATVLFSLFQRAHTHGEPAPGPEGLSERCGRAGKQLADFIEEIASVPCSRA